MPPCPHFDLRIVQRSKRQSAVASAAYQSGERLFSECDQKQKYYSHKSEIVHTEIMLSLHAPPEYADRNTLWNAAEAAETRWQKPLPPTPPRMRRKSAPALWKFWNRCGSETEKRFWKNTHTSFPAACSSVS